MMFHHAKNRSVVIGTLIISVVLIIGGFVFFLFLQDSNHMVFPRKTHGSFMEAPHLVKDGDQSYVEWMTDAPCGRNGYEVQEVGYTEDNRKMWGGRGDAECGSFGEGFRCRAEVLEEMRERRGVWRVQVHGYACPDEGRYYVSDVVEM